jgi:hypothetical protein
MSELIEIKGVRHAYRTTGRAAAGAGRAGTVVPKAGLRRRRPVGLRQIHPDALIAG